MAERYLIDTSAVIKFLNESFPPIGISFLDKVVDDGSILSIITEIELQVWNPSNEEDAIVYKTFVEGSTTLGIDDDVVQQTIYVRKTYRLKLPDAVIAATALVFDMTLISDNDIDFKKVIGLKYINPMQMK